MGISIFVYCYFDIILDYFLSFVHDPIQLFDISHVAMDSSDHHG